MKGRTGKKEISQSPEALIEKSKAVGATVISG
jgi:hypothetical protein